MNEETLLRESVTAGAPDNPVPPRIHVLAKPSGATCNLACSYCFFLDKELLYPSSDFRMSDELLENYIRQLIESHRTDEVTVAWQGGEPTLMGLDFYRKAIRYQDKYKRPGMTFENTMQTNGTLLDDEWCEFYKENNFLIGLSMDGPRHLHDAHRVDKGGAPTFDKVMRGLRLLQKHDVEYNILVTVNGINADHPKELYRFLRDEVGTEWIQFIPVVERMNQDGLNLIQMGEQVSERSVGPDQFGRFLIQIYDEWVMNDVGSVFIQMFEAALRNWAGMGSSGMCIFDQTCGAGPALEHNGELYACDHFVEPGYVLGNIQQDHMIELMGTDQQHDFGLDKLQGLPRMCQECDVRFACHGECPKNRFTLTPDGEPGLNYLCAGYMAFFHRIDGSNRIILSLMQSGRQASEVMGILAEKEDELQTALKVARANEGCPCGSGMSFRNCHGWKRPRRRGAKREVQVGLPRPPVGATAKELQL